MSDLFHSGTLSSLAQDEEQSKAFVRIQEILGEHDASIDADANKAIDTVGWEKAW